MEDMSRARDLTGAIDSFDNLPDTEVDTGRNEIKPDIPDFPFRHSFTEHDLEKCADGELFGPGNAQLPSAPLLMLDRITQIATSGGRFNRGYAHAELDLDYDSWFFRHHFKNDPIMPGCMLLESLWQLTGFYLAWAGHAGRGRVLDSGSARFLEAVLPKKQTLNIHVHIRRILVSDKAIGIADGFVQSNDRVVCTAKSIKLGLV